MRVDQNARQKLADMQQDRALTAQLSAINAKVNTAPTQIIVQTPPAPGTEELTSKVSQLTNTLSEQQKINGRPKTPVDDLAAELRNLQKVIGGGNLIESLLTLQTAFKINNEAVPGLQAFLTLLTEKLRLVAELESKIPSEIKVQLKEDLNGLQITGQVGVNSLPPVEVSNLVEISSIINRLANNIQVLQSDTVKAIQATKTEFPKFPKGFNVENEVKVVDFSDLLEGIEELKKGFNILINKEVGNVTFPNKSIPVEIQNWRIPNPVTNVSINAMGGFAKSTKVTVTAALTPLPGEVLNNRRGLTIFNNGAVTIELGGSELVFGNGMPIAAGNYSPAIDAGDKLIVYARTASGSCDVRVLEVSDIESGR